MTYTSDFTHYTFKDTYGIDDHCLGIQIKIRSLVF